MSCGGCIRFARRPIQGTRYGFCRWPGIGPRPYWHVERPEAVLMVPGTHEGCAAEKARRPR